MLFGVSSPDRPALSPDPINSVRPSVLHHENLPPSCCSEPWHACHLLSAARPLVKTEVFCGRACVTRDTTHSIRGDTQQSQYVSDKCASLKRENKIKREHRGNKKRQCQVIRSTTSVWHHDSARIAAFFAAGRTCLVVSEQLQQKLRARFTWVYPGEALGCKVCNDRSKHSWNTW